MRERFSCVIQVDEYVEMGDRDDKRLVVGASGKGTSYMGALAAALACFARMEGRTIEEVVEMAQRERRIA